MCSHMKFGVSKDLVLMCMKIRPLKTEKNSSLPQETREKLFNITDKNSWQHAHYYAEQPEKLHGDHVGL